MSFIISQIYRFNKIPIIIPPVTKLTLKFIWKFKESKISKIILKKNKTEGLLILTFKTKLQ